MENLEHDDIEAIWVQVKVKDKLIIICSTYLPPHVPAEQQSRYLDQLTDSVTQAHSHSPEALFVMGDLNGGNCWLPPNAPPHSPISSFENKLKSTSEALGLTQLINTATRIQDKIHNIRDLIFTDSPHVVTDSGTLSSFSNLDHFPVCATLSINFHSEDFNNTKQVWDFQNTDIDSLVHLLSQMEWNEITDKDVDLATEAFTEAILDTASRCIPTKTVRTRSDKLWVTTDLRRQIRKRDRLFKLARARQTDYDWTRWRTQRNLVTNINRKLKKEHIRHKVDLLLENKKDPFKYHTILKNITGVRRDAAIPPLVSDNGTVVSENHSKAELLNSYFSAQTNINITDVQHAHLHEFENSQDATPNHIDSIIFTPNEVLNIINRLDASKACGPDKIPTKLLKMVAIYIAEPLTKIFNKSLASGKYPSIWKRAIVKPIYKGKGSPSDLKNYRPISLLPCVSKIFEKLVFKRFYDHITSHQLLTDNQSGYRPGHNTQLQLAYLTDKLYKTLDNSEDFTIIYLDISRYFEKIWHAGLLAKCKLEFGIRGQVLSWLKSYLDDRSQQVQIGGDLSPPLTLKAGVPQGSVLGPLLAILYLNGLSDITSNQTLYFADDSSIHCSHTPDTLQAKEIELQHDLNAIHDYGIKWAITFNSNKTTQQTFSNRRNPTIPKLTFGGQDICLTNKHKHLGLTFSSDLKFKQHINETLLKFNRALSPLYQVAPYIPRKELHQIYLTYVRPHLDYCSAVYDENLTTFDSKRLEKAQNRAARLITGAIRRTPVNKLRNELGWSSVADRRRKQRLLLFHKLVHDPAIPMYIKAIVPSTRETSMSRILRNSNSQTITHPITRTTNYSQSFIPSTIRTWNDLPAEVRLSNSFKIFKKNIEDMIGPENPSSFNSYGSKQGNTLHTRLRLQASSLNAHKFSFGQANSAQCLRGHRKEDNTHYFLHCSIHTRHREELFHSLTTLLNKDFELIPPAVQIDLLLNGPKETNSKDESLKTALAIQHFIFKTNRFH